MKNIIPKINNRHSLNILSVSTLEGYELVQIDSILYMLAENCYTIIFLTDNIKIISTKNLGFYEKRLVVEDSFIRIHHSIIINLLKVKRYIRTGGGQVVIVNEKRLPVSRARKTFLLYVLKQLG